MNFGLILENPMDHHLTTPCTATGSTLTAQHQAANTPASAHCKLDAGQAVTLHAKQLSVLRVTDGRVWATLSHAGPYSRVTGGDHFLSLGQSLTLLPGQALVVESFGLPGSSPTAVAHFSWESHGRPASAWQVVRPSVQVAGSGVLEPLHDLRHALGLVATACGRLVKGLVHEVVRVPIVLLNMFATIFVADRAGTSCAEGTLSCVKKDQRSA